MFSQKPYSFSALTAQFIIIGDHFIKETHKDCSGLYWFFENQKEATRYLRWLGMDGLEDRKYD